MHLTKWLSIISEARSAMYCWMMLSHFAPHLEREGRRQFCEFGLQTSHTRPIIFPRMGYYSPERIRNIQIKSQMWPNCHFDSLNLVRNSNLEFEFMHKFRATA
jgi:hypothetical protein